MTPTDEQVDAGQPFTPRLRRRLFPRIRPWLLPRRRMNTNMNICQYGQPSLWYHAHCQLGTNTFVTPPLRHYGLFTHCRRIRCRCHLPKANMVTWFHSGAAWLWFRFHGTVRLPPPAINHLAQWRSVNGSPGHRLRLCLGPGLGTHLPA